MKNKPLKLEQLKVTSFKTSQETDRIKGGAVSGLVCELVKRTLVSHLGPLCM